MHLCTVPMLPNVALVQSGHSLTHSRSELLYHTNRYMQRGSLMENYAIRKLQEQIICQVFDLPSQHCNTLSLPPHLIAKHRECRRRRYAPLMPPNLVAMCNHSLPISPCYVIVLEFDLVCLKKTLFGLVFQWDGVSRLQLRKLSQSTNSAAMRH